ncbi:lysozyme [Luteimonas terricola]|uniref:Lysozyme n=1 Tax=Luteimonas terricola TaxID=645597 RepID=A0ABQ2EHT7_9GAMM|nr:lysozyme [Luteimonas terricola]GGK08705.1 lysozyme [Luteimonas terricola]
MATVEPPGSGKTGPIVGGVAFGSAMLLAFLMLWESSSKPILIVYPDRLAGGLPTVCDGLTRHVTTTPIVVGERWTLEKCERETAAAVVRVQVRLIRCFKDTPPQSVFDAASSHAWNLGAGATCGSAAMKAWNRGDYPLGCRRLYVSDGGRMVWSYVKTGKRLANGQPEYRFVRGLQNRRRAEDKLCMRDVA